MVQFEFEFVAVLIGAVAYVVYWFFPFRALFLAPKECKTTTTEEPSPEPITGEPSPEPQPGEESDPCTMSPIVINAPKATKESKCVQTSQWHWMVAGLVLLCLAKFLSHSLGNHMHSDAPVASNDYLLHDNVTNPAPEVVPQIPFDTTGLSPAVASEPELVTSPVVTPPLADVPPPVQSSEKESATGAHQFDVPFANLAADAVPHKQDDLISWKLTRQVMAVKKIAGHIHYRSNYWTTITVGSPPVSFKVVFDTGSGQLIIPTTHCKSNSCVEHQQYKKSLSYTAQDIDYDGTVVRPGSPRDQITVTFGTGEINGVFYDDQVCLHKDAVTVHGTNLLSANETNNYDENENTMGCMGMRFVGAIEMADDPFRGFKFDGIMGLGLEGLSQAPEFNFGKMMGKQLQMQGYKRPYTFSVFLAEDSKEQSEITFGGWIEDQHEDEHIWAPVFKPELGLWVVEIKSLRVDGEILDYCKDGECRAVMDTGTSLLAVPKSAFKVLFTSLTHNPVDDKCDGPGPTLKIDLEGITLALEPHDYAMLLESRGKPSNQTNQTIKEMNETVNNNVTKKCKPMLMAMDFPELPGPKLFILGEPVLRKYHTVYDSEAKQIGFSRAVHKSVTSDESQEAKNGRNEDKP